MFNKKLLLALVAFAVSTQIQAAALPDPALDDLVGLETRGVSMARSDLEGNLETREPKGIKTKPKLPSRDTVQKLIDSVGVAVAAAQLGVDAATLQQYVSSPSRRDVELELDTREPKGLKPKPGKPKLPSRDTVQKLIDSVGAATAAAQLGVDIATLQEYMSSSARRDFETDLEAREPKGIKPKPKPKLPSHDTVQKLIDTVGLAAAAAQLGVDAATLQEYMSSPARRDVDLELEAREPKGIKPKPKPKLPSRDTVQKLIDTVGLAAAAAQLGVDAATLQEYMSSPARRDVDLELEAREPKGIKPKPKPKLPSRDTVQKLIDTVGLAAAAAQLGVDAATLQEYMSSPARRDVDLELEAREPKGIKPKPKPKLPSHDTVQKLIDTVGLAAAAAQLGVDAATLQEYMSSPARREVDDDFEELEARIVRAPPAINPPPKKNNNTAIANLPSKSTVFKLAGAAGLAVAVLQQYP